MKQEITNNRLATMPISDGTLTKEKLISMRTDMQEQLKQTRLYITMEETRRAKILSAMNEIQEHTVCFKFNSQYFVNKKDRFVIPFFKTPLRSASRIILSAARSLTLPDGLKYSNFPNIFAFTPACSR